MADTDTDDSGGLPPLPEGATTGPALPPLPDGATTGPALPPLPAGATTSPQPAPQSAEPPEWHEPKPPTPDLVGTPDEPYEPPNAAAYKKWLETSPVGSTVKMNDGTVWTKPDSYHPIRDTGILGAIPAGLVGAGKEVAATAKTVGGGKPEYQEPDLLAAQPMEWGDFLHPSTLAKKFLYNFAESAPTVASAVFGGVLGTAAGGGPEEPIGWAGGIAGTATGAALGSTIQSLGTNFGQALHETNGDGEKAWNLALKRTGIEAAGSAAGFSLFSVAPFTSTMKNMLFQAFGLQPAAAVAQRVAGNVAEGKPAGEGALETIPGAIIGTAAPMAAHEAIGRMAGHGEAPAAGGNQSQTQGGSNVPPPAVGEKIGMPMGDKGVVGMEVSRVTKDGDVVLKDPDGVEHPFTADDFARLRTEFPNAEEAPPAGEPTAETPPPEGAPGTPPAQPEPTPPGAAAATPPAEPVTPPLAPQDTQVALPPVDVTPPGDASAPAQPPIPPNEAPPAAPAAAAPTADFNDSLDDLLRNEVVSGAGSGAADEQAAIQRDEAEVAQKQQPAPASQPAAAKPAIPGVEAPQAIKADEIASTMGAMGKGMTEGLYQGLFDALGGADNAMARMRDPAIARAKPFYDAGLIKSPEDLQKLVAAGYDPVRAGLSPAQESAPAPDYVRERMAQDWELGQRLGIVPDVEKMAADGLTAAQIIEALGERMAGVPKEDRRNLIIAIRSQLGIPSMDQATEYADWLKQYRERQPVAAEEAAPVGGGAQVAPRLGELVEPSEPSAPARPAAEPTPEEQPAVTPVPAEPEAVPRGTEEPRPADVRTNETAPENVPTKEGQSENVPNVPLTEAAEPSAPREVPNGPVVTEETHTKTGEPIAMVRFPEKPGIEDLGANAKRFGKEGGSGNSAYWNSFRGGGMDKGWLFKGPNRVENANKFAEWARDKMAPKEAEKPAGENPTPPPAATEARPKGWEEIGKNHIGQTLYEDENGVRSYIENGVRNTEPVGLRPRRGGMEYITDRRDRPEYMIAEPHPATGRIAPEITPREIEALNAPAGENPTPTRGTRAPEDVAAQIDEARERTNTEPTDGQKEAGNYAKGRTSFHGIPFVMENPAGSVRRGVGPDGTPWEAQLPVDYGYIGRTEGADGDQVDAYVGPDHQSQTAYVIDQFNPEGGFDEHKVMLGFNDWPSAREAYLNAFSDGRGEERLGNATPMSLDELKTWLKEGDTKNPIGQGDLLQPKEEAPTLSAEAENGLQNPVPPGDEGAGAEALHGTPEERPAGSIPPTEGDRGEPPEGRNPEGQEEPEPAGRADSGRDRLQPDDRVQPGGLPAEPGTPGGSADTSRGLVPPPDAREVELEAAAEVGTPTPQGREVDWDVQGRNFELTPEVIGEDRPPRTKAADNLAAIELAKKILSEDRPATKEEQAALARYVGWGGLSGAFQDSTGRFGAGLEDVGRRLRQVLTKQEYDAARESTQYAHYTSAPVINAMWRAMERMGFKGGQVFEPGMGVGHFNGLMPSDLAAASKYHGLEIDPLTASIAKLIYPESGIRQADFIRTPIPPNSFDMAIGNPPFSDVVVRGDPKYKARGFMLHDYFFAKSLDSIRPGGLLGFVTSAGTMNKLNDAARQYMAERAEFVGGVRLNSGAFAKNAGTEVTTDILFFKKRMQPEDLKGQVPDWAQTVVKELPDSEGNPTQGNVSRYFAEHPEQVLGQEGFFDKLYQGRYAVHAEDGVDYDKALSDAIERLPENMMDEPLTPKEKAELDFSSAEKKDGSFYVQNGQLMQYREGAGNPIKLRGKGVEGGFAQKEVDKIKQLVPLRDARRDVMRAYLSGDEATAAAARAKLNKVYDDFVAKNGPINKVEYSYRRPSRVQMEGLRSKAREDARASASEFEEGDFDARPLIDKGMKAADIARLRDAARERAKKEGREFDEGTFDESDVPDIVIPKYENIDPFNDDPESYSLRAMEAYDDKTGVGTKRRIFFENPLDTRPEPQIKSPNDGILWSLNRYGRLDLDQIADKLGSTKADVIDKLGDSVYRLPGTAESYTVRDDYLSGDVVSKLKEAEAAAQKDPAYQRNVEALKAVQPAPVSPADIGIRMGMPWISPDTIESFANSLNLGRLDVSYEKHFGTWGVDNWGYGDGQAEWETQRMTAAEIMQHALNRTSPKVYDRDPDTRKPILNPDATQAAQDKVAAMHEAFSSWVNNNPEILDGLADAYNSKYNRTVLRQWDGSYLTTPGISKDWNWRPHQTRVIARGIQDGNVYIAHAVGAGKTSTAIGLAMEQKRLGLIRKPMIVVPNHMLGQFAKEWYEQYPAARLMIADEDRFHTSRRKQFIADVAEQDLDGVILTNSAFKKIAISDEFEGDLINEELGKLDEALRAMGVDPDADNSKRGRGGGDKDRFTVKRLENRKKKLQEMLRGKTNSDVDKGVTFEELGVDHLTVDEAHQFRKLPITTQLSLKGISSEGSDMSWDLYAKSRYLEKNNPGRSLVMMSGTPVTNTMGELYSLSRYMQPEKLAEHGLSNFDSWAQTFGETKSELEQTATGAYEQVERFSELTNVPELYKMVGDVMDVVTENQLGEYVTRPEIKDGQREFHLAPRSDFLDAYQKKLGERVEAIKNRRGPPQKGDDIILSIIGDGRLSALDPRFVDPSQSADSPSKLNEMIGNVYRLWQESKNQQFYEPGTKKELFKGPATQLVFSNLGIASKATRPFSGYRWMKQAWTRMGIPPSEIAFIGDYPKPTDKQRLFNDMNEGKVRVLVGSVQKMGTGLNVQRRLLAVHNLDPLWYPADDTQRNGRILRQGNLNPEVQIHDYSTKGTYDSTMWQMMGRKGRFIEQFFRGDPTLRNMEDLGEAGMYEQASAMSTSDPRMMELTDMRQSLKKLERRQAAHQTEQYGMRRDERNYRESYIPNGEETIQNISQQIAQRDAGADRMLVGDQPFEKRSDYLKALGEEFDAAKNELGVTEARPIGEYRGFPLRAIRGADTKDGPVVTIQARTPTGWGPLEGGITAARAINSLDRDLDNLEARRDQMGRNVDVWKQKLAAIQGQIGKRFPDEDKIQPLRDKVATLAEELRGAKGAAGFDWNQFTVDLEGKGAATGPDGREYTANQGGRGSYVLWAKDPLDPRSRNEYVAGGTSLRDVVDQIKQTSTPGAGERMGPFGEAVTRQPESYRDLGDEYAQYAADRQGDDPHQVARDWVRDMGEKTGLEHLAANDAGTGEVTHAFTSGLNSDVVFTPELVSALQDENNSLVVHHNHPSDSALSAQDIRQLALPGLDTIVAHGKSGDAFSARLSPEVAMSVDRDELRDVLSNAYATAAQEVYKRLDALVEGKKMTLAQADKAYADLINKALDAGGLIDYASTRKPALQDALARNIVRKAGDAVGDYLESYGVPRREPEDFDARANRSTLPLRPEEVLGGLPGGDEEAPSGRSGRDEGDGSGAAAPRELEDALGLAEEPNDFADRAEKETVRAAVNQPGVPRGTGGWWQKAMDTLGVGRGSPGGGRRDFNAVNRQFTAPASWAAYDQRSNQKWLPELAKFRDSAELLSKYHDGMQSWQGQPREVWRKLFSAMELLTLDGRNVPLDGRAVIVENTNRPLAELSKPGDVIRLTTPDEIKMFTDYRRTMEQVWKDVVSEAARSYGWEGEPTSEAMFAAAENMAGPQKRSMERAAKTVAAVEWQARDAYLPLMRNGDYYLRVKPKEGAPQSDINPWNGEGYPPTVMYKMIDSQTPLERAMGGWRSGQSKNVTAALDELRQTFPESDFDVEHGYVFDKKNQIKDLDISAIDKLMMLVQSDARAQMTDRLMRTGMDRESARAAARSDYDELVDTVLDQVKGERAGFRQQRRGIPGYNADFAKSTGNYLGWLSNYISAMRHRDAIEAGNAAVDSHPDPRVRAFWRDWDRRQEDYGDQLHGPLARMRQGSFYWLLGMNAATTAKILLHGPLRGAPILSTGLGGAGRTQAIASYLNASRQMASALRVGKNGIELDFSKASGLSPEERGVLDRALANGIVHEQTADEIGMARHQGEEVLSPRSRAWRRVLDIWGSNVSASDRMVRGAMLIGAYRTAARVGMDAINKVWDRDLNWRNLPEKTPETFAHFMVDKTVGIWGDINRLPILRSELGALVGQFKQYEIGYLSNMHQMLTKMGPEGKITAALMLGGLGFMGGTLALPFANDAKDALGWAYKTITDISPDLDTQLHNIFEGMMPGTGEALTHGARPFGIDWSGIGFGDIISRNAQSPLNALGASVSMPAGAAQRAWERSMSGQDELGALSELLPNSVKHMLQAVYPEISVTSATGKSKVESAENMSEADRVRMGLGFQTETRALKREEAQKYQHENSQYHQGLSVLEDRIANLTDRGDMAGAKEAREQAIQLIKQGVHAGAFVPQTMSEFNRITNSKILIRKNPELGSKTTQRMRAMENAQNP